MSSHNAKPTIRWIPLVFLAGVLILYCAPLVLGQRVLSGGDLVNQYIPYKNFWRYWIKQGVFPLWNPLIFCGRPYLADIQLGLFYPPNLLHIVLRPEWTFTLLAIIHLLIGLWGSYLFLTKVMGLRWQASCMGALIFIFSGFFLTRLYSGIVLFIFTGVWTPLIFYAFCRWIATRSLRFASLTALLMALQLLAGAPQIAIISSYAIAILFLVFLVLNRRQILSERRLLFRLIAGTLLIMILAAGVCAVQLLPTYEFMRHSFERAGKTAWEYATIDSLRPRFLLTWVFPDIFHSPTRPEIYWGGLEGYWEINAYVSIPALVLVVLFLLQFISRPSRRHLFAESDSSPLNRAFVVGSLIFIIVALGMALGRYSPLYWVAYHILPGINKFRVPARWLFLYILGITILASLSLDTLIKKKEELAPHLRWSAVFLLILIVISAVLCYTALPALLKGLGLYKNFANAPPDISAEAIASCLQRARISVLTTFTLATLTAVILVLFLLHRLTHKTLTVLLLGIIVFDVFVFGIKFIEAIPARYFSRKFYPASSLTSVLKGHLNEYGHRFLALDDVYSWLNDQNQMEIYPDRAMVFSLCDARGYDPVYIRSFGEFMNALSGRPIDKSPGALLFVEDITNPTMLDWLDVRIILTYRDLNYPELRLLRHFPFGLNVYSNPSALGPAFIARAKKFNGDKYQLLSLLTETKDSATVYTNIAPPELNPQPRENLPEANSVQRIYFTPNRQVYEVSCRSGNILVFSENYYPGWRVLIDNTPAPLIRVNHTLSGVFITPGKHIVTKYFLPSSLLWGSVISLLSLLITCGVRITKVRALLCGKHIVGLISLSD
ncbi:hypothetical protein J7M23_01205 [Candidatus Sumerlaeota bacterium]|nr:hypothetical protein [Candidatus Sumerlaeota bacterium]